MPNVISSGAKPQIEVSDEELVRLFQLAGDPNAFDELFKRHRRRIYCACRGFFGDSGAAEDATQEAFLRAFEHLRGFAGGNFGGWLMRIAKNTCIDIWRKQRHEETSDGSTPIEDVPSQSALEQASDVHMAVETLLQEMKKLAPEQCRCLELKMEGYSYEETAASLNMSVEAVKSHLQNGRRMLWSKMEGTLTQLR